MAVPGRGAFAVIAVLLAAAIAVQAVPRPRLEAVRTGSAIQACSGEAAKRLALARRDRVRRLLDSRGHHYGSPAQHRNAAHLHRNSFPPPRIS